MDAAPNPRPGLRPALATAAVLLALLALLILPVFSGDAFLHTQGRSLSAWDHHFASSGWDSHLGMGQREAPLPPGVTGAFSALAKQTGDPSVNFANYLPVFALFLLGMAAWYCVRQLGGDSLVCGIMAVAATFSGVFITRSLEFSPGLAVLGAAMFLTFGTALRPRLTWPRAVLAGLALGVGILETGIYTGGILALATVIVSRVLAHARMGDHHLSKEEVGCILLILITAMAVVTPVHAGLEKVAYPFLYTRMAGLEMNDWATLPVAGFHGFRLDAPDSSLHRGTLGSSSLHVGTTLLLLGAWGVANALRRGSATSRRERSLILILAAVAVISLGASLKLPHMTVLTCIALILLGTLGLKGFDQWLSNPDHEKTRSFGSGGFDSAWRLGMVGMLVIGAVAFIVYGNHIDVPSDSPNAKLLTAMYSASHWQIGEAVIFTFTAIVTLIACSLAKWTTANRRMGLIILGLILGIELFVAAGNFVRFDGNAPNKSVTSVAEVLQDRSRMGRLALLDEYQRMPLENDREDFPMPLDQLVLDLFLAPTPPQAKDRGPDPATGPLTDAFYRSLDRYQSADAMAEFNRLAAIMLKTGDPEARQQAAEEIQKLPGGPEFVRTAGNQSAMQYILHTASDRQRHLAGLEAVRQLDARLSLTDTHAFAKRGIIRAHSRNHAPLPAKETVRTKQHRESIRRIIRQWELSSTRFFLCHAGNPFLSNQIQAYFRQHDLPIYRNALNEVLDPANRRFHTLAAFEFVAEGDRDNPVYELTPSTNNATATVGLMEFTGALPRAMLFADWQTGVESDQINKILFSPGFIPQQRVLLETTDIPAPEQPSQTPNMPTPEFITDTPKEVTLKIPATDYNAVLMLNDQYEKDWQVTIDGQPATLLRANGNARAVHLPAASNERTVTFTYPPHDLLTLPSTLAVFLGLGIAGIGSFRNWRRFLREEMESDADESIDDTDSSEDPKPDET